MNRRQGNQGRPPRGRGIPLIEPEGPPLDLAPPRRAGRPPRGRGRPRRGITNRYERERERDRFHQRTQSQRNAALEQSYPVFGSLTDYTETMLECAREFDEAMRAIQMNTCANCKRSFPGLKINAANLCNHCTNQRTANMFTRDNLMDPGEIPPELKDLTDIEKMLIAQVHPVIRLYRLRGAQFAYSGNVISFRQNIDSFCTVLPRLPTDVATILFDKSTPTGISTFKANRRRIERALIYLKNNNIYYRNITISRENLSLIPEDGDITPLLLTFITESQSTQTSPSQEAPIDENEPIEESFVPLMEPPDRDECIRRGLKLPYPTTESVPINEFETEGFIACAFPALFPTGEADFLNRQRPLQPSLDEYFKYLLEYHDRRFIKEPRFLYFAMNMVQRHQAISSSSVFIKRARISALTAAEVMELMRNDSTFIKRVMVYAAKIRSTKPYWAQRCGELLDMVRHIGPPAIFFTLSAADYHWPDLFRVLVPGVDPERLTSKQRADLLHENYDISAFFFQYRCEQFIKLVLSKVWNITDMWYRYEWQWRGSPHLHGLLWLDDAPEIDRTLSEEEVEEMRQFCDRQCSAWNLEFEIVENQQLPHNNPPPVNPCRKRFSDIPQSEREADLGELLNTFQRHTKCDPRCLRKVKGKLECKHKFPFELLLEAAKIERDANGKLTFYPKRNDRFMGKHNPFNTHVWRGNTDWAIVVNLDAVLNYIAKYASKGENGSKNLQDLLEIVASKVSDESRGASVVTCCTTSCVGERDYPAQEAAHILKGYKMFHCSRSFVTLCLFDDDWQHVTVDDDNQISIGKKLVAKYRDRPTTDEFRDLDLLEFSKFYYTKKQNGVERYVRRRQEAVVRIFPRFRLSGDDEQNEKFYRQQVILRLPFTQEPYSDLLFDTTTNVLFETWLARYESLNLQVEDPLEFPEQEDEGEILPDINEQNIQDPYMVAAGMLNNIPGEQSAPMVGRRPMDMSHDWLAASRNYPDITQVNEFLKTFNRHQE